MQSVESPGFFVSIKHKVSYSARMVILLFYRLFYTFLYHFELIPRPLPPVTITSQSDKYIESRKSTFLNSYKTYDNKTINENIEQCFYDAKLHAKIVENADNELEKTWKRRMMLENTPRGNIIMYYDAFKQGFVYYSDNSNIPYFVINAAIMKYVTLYRCRDFFIDDQITPENHPSPLLPNSTKLPIEPVSTPKEPVTNNSNSKAFAKLKNYNTASGKLNTIKETPKNTEKNTEKNTTAEKQYTRNKIIYSGKMSNLFLLQKTKPSPKVTFSSHILDGLTDNANAQKNAFNYKDYKRLKSAKQI
jgi:hypothetical protein